MTLGIVASAYVASGVTVGDDFNRANGTLTTPWVLSGMATSAFPVIASNHVEPSGFAAVNYVKYNQSATTDHCFAQVDATFPTTSAQYAEINALLCDASGNNYQFAWAGDSNTGSYTLYRNNSAAAGTTLTSAAGPASGTRTLRIERNGSTITCYANGTQVLTTTDATYTARTPGIGLYRDNASSAAIQADNFTGGDA